MQGQGGGSVSQVRWLTCGLQRIRDKVQLILQCSPLPSNQAESHKL